MRVRSGAHVHGGGIKKARRWQRDRRHGGREAAADRSAACSVSLPKVGLLGCDHHTARIGARAAPTGRLAPPEVKKGEAVIP